MERTAAPLSGRDEQLGRLREAVRAARSGVPGTVVVEGEAGIGKTRLVTEVASEESAHGAVVLWGNCSAVAGRDVPLGPIIDALGDLRRALGDDVLAQVAGPRRPVLAGLVPGAFGAVPDGPAPALGQVFGAVTDLLRATAADRPVLLLLEDVHWADDSTLDLVDYLTRSVRAEQLVVVVTARTDDPAYERVRAPLAEVGRAPGAVRVALPRLTPEQVGEQVRALEGSAEPEDLRRIAELSGGVPFLVEQVVDAGVEESGALASRLLGHRIAGLSVGARTVVDAAAAALTPPPADDLATVAALESAAFDAGLLEAVRTGVLVVRGGSVGFRHALLQEAALAELLPGTARTLHQRWADVLAGGSGGSARVIELAHHRLGAGDRGAALEALLAAAAHAGRLSAYVERDRMLERAIDLWPQVPDAEERTGTDLPGLLAEAAEAAQQAQRLDDAASRVARARELLPSGAPAHRRAWLDVLDYWRRNAEDHAASPDEVRRAAAAFDGIPPSRQQAVTYAVAGNALAQHGDPAGSLDYADRALAAARALGDEVVEARALAMRGMALSSLGRDDEAMDALRRAVTAADRSGDLSVRQHARAVLTVVGETSGHHREAEGAAREALELLGGDRPGPLSKAWAQHSSNLAEELIESGQWDEAALVLERALELTRGEPEWIHDTPIRVLAQLLVWRGERDVDLDWTEVIESDALGRTNLDALVWGHLSWAEVASRLAETDVARRMYRSVLADDRTASLPDGTYRLVAVAARTEADIARASTTDTEAGEGEWAVERIGRLLAAMTPRNLRHGAYAATARAHLRRRAGDDDAATWWEVVTAWRPAEVPHELGWALVRFAEAALLEGRRAEAATALSEARAIAWRLKATPLTEAADAVARQGRLPVSEGRDLPFGLTARELEVLELLADGHGNAEIGRRLVISAKTASVHVTHILQKLDVHTRGEAAALAHRSGITAEG